jgi:hypothetical protein
MTAAPGGGTTQEQRMARARKAQGARDAQQRAALAEESARLMSEHGIRDYRQAVRKAAARLGINDQAMLPAAEEVDQALRERQRLFSGGEQIDALLERRRVAVDAMRFLAEFSPRLVGAVLDGTADRHSPVELHLFSDDPDAVIRFLHEHGIPHTVGSRALQIEAGRSERVPLHAFAADGIEVELLVLGGDRLRQPPLEPGGERRQARASLAALQQMLQDGANGPA